MRRRALVLAVLLLVALLGGVTASPVVPARGEEPPRPREGAAHAVPLYGSLVHPYDAPDDPYSPGHRGADVAAPPGTVVRASDDGVVAFAGTVVGNRTVTVDHGGALRTSYSYLASAAVTQGQTVTRGQLLGTIGAGHDDTLPPHVHLSARRDGVYFDPLELYVGSGYADLIALTG